jgi:hypothetical protein
LPLEPLPQVAGPVPAIDPNAPQAAPSEVTPPPEQEPAKAPGRPARASDASSTYQTIAWIALAGTVAFGAASGAFWAVGSSQYDEVADQCGSTCSEMQIDDSGVATSDLLTSVFLGAAVASGVASGVFFVLAATEAGDEPSRAETVRLEVGPLGLRVRGAL